MTTSPARLRIGTSGYNYPHWRGVLYPPGVPQRNWLPVYASTFDTVELNATFYRLPTPETTARWRALVPADFVFAVKGSRYLTHMKRLLDAAEGLRRFYRPVRRLGDKLGPTLWQLPPRMKPDAERLDRFLSRVPPGRHALEFRDPAWYAEAICDVLDAHGAAFCEHDQVDRPPPRRTGGWRYLRFHGTTGRYAGRYGAGALRPYAEELLGWARSGRDAYAYFNNDVGGHAVHDALALLALVGQERPAPELHTPPETAPRP
ncbi:DUF72 domain-containing protein [Anaeromyxobacter oryzisoli]|uniref:DUF72 domain-containing protein n=1 Tax=Anaeromyxobacter oryzisoli TaxID=2925408 RepID=UPI001F59C02F|nr:DUF72 domain-containing protein [Anaeromyxobacter sp. SG63]